VNSFPLSVIKICGYVDGFVSLQILLNASSTCSALFCDNALAHTFLEKKSTTVKMYPFVPSSLN